MVKAVTMRRCLSVTSATTPKASRTTRPGTGRVIDDHAPRHDDVRAGDRRRAGAVGAMLAESARAEGDSVTVVDPAAAPIPGVDGVCGDVTDPDPQVRALLAEADVVILAVPEAVAVAAVPVVDGAMKPARYWWRRCR